MPVNFFEANCQTFTNASIFGICDDPPPPHNQAYIDITTNKNWIAIVNNPNKINITFTAIDYCIIILKSNGIDKESSCDCMITYQNSLILIELKERHSKGWLVKAKNQLKNTIVHLKLNHNISKYNLKTAYIANNLRPSMASSEFTRKQMFKDITGFLLKIETNINL